MYYIYGGPEGEHLRAELKDGYVLLVSHEQRFTKTDTQWRDRIFTDVPNEAWREIARLIDGL